MENKYIFVPRHIHPEDGD